MVRYFWGWTPLVIVGTVVFLTIPYLAVFALLIVSLVALAALAGAIVYVPYTLSRAISRHWHNRTGTDLRTAPVLSPARRQTA